MDELSATRCGMVDTTLAYAARYTVATVAAPALIVLDDVHLRMGIAYVAIGSVAPSELPPMRPSDRWMQLMRHLFPFARHGRSTAEGDTRPPWVPPARGVRGLMATVPDEQRRALRSVMAYAASFLLAEAMNAEDQIALAVREHRGPRQRRPFALVPADARSAINSTVRWAAMALLDRIEADGGPLLLAPDKERYLLQPCRLTRWKAECDIIHPRTPACPPLHPNSEPC